MRRSCGAVRVLGRTGFLLVLFLVLLAFSPAAFAGPPDPTLSLDELRTRLESGTPVVGYMKTTMKGYAVEEIPLTVEGLVEDSWGTLILFEATGEAIERIGGIALGMSGSPVYVSDGGVFKLVGAVSYGDSFTLGGMGMATPIEYMSAIQDTHVSVGKPKVGTYRLAQPLETENGRVASVVIARNAKAAARVDAAAGQTVMAPLALMEIGGLRPQSRAFKELAAQLERSGLNVRAASGSGAWTGDPAPPLVAGSPCVVMFSTGGVWFGGAGTVTYVDGDTALMFGHPAWWVGSTEASLNAGYVAGVWPSALAPYKLIAPRDAKGAVTQDRYWGVLGLLGQQPDMFPVRTHAVYPAEGREATDSSSVSQWFVTQPSYYDIPAYVATSALTAANDAESYPGSAQTTTTVRVSDGTGSYTIERDNLWDTGDDVAWEATWDVDTIMAALTANPDGVLHPRVESIDLEASVLPTRKSARFADVVLPNGLRTGENQIIVKCYPYGSSEVEEIPGTLTLPKGMSTSGWISVVPGSWGSWYDDFDYDYEGQADLDPPKTLAEVVDELNSSVANNDLLVAFEPRGARSPSDVAEARISTPYVFRGEFYRSTARVTVRASRSTVPFEGSVSLAGFVLGVQDNVKLDILRRDAGKTGETYVKTVTAFADGGQAFFRTTVGGLKRTTSIIARTHATPAYLPGSDSARVKVSALVGLHVTKTRTSAKLSVRVRPTAAVGKVRLERRIGGRWVVRNSKTKATNKSVLFTLGRGTHKVRVRFYNGDICAPGLSKTITVRVP